MFVTVALCSSTSSSDTINASVDCAVDSAEHFQGVSGSLPVEIWMAVAGILGLDYHYNIFLVCKTFYEHSDSEFFLAQKWALL